MSNQKYFGEFNKINTELKAYFLGLLFADGSIGSKIDSNGKKHYVVRISIHEEDKEILYDIQKEICDIKVSSHDYSRYNENCATQYSLVFQSEQMYHDMINLGLVERKSYENKELIKFPKIEEHLKKHFVRGFFDGDGSISIPASRPNLRQVDICGVSFKLINGLSKWFERYNCKPKFRTKFNEKYQKQNLFIIEWRLSEDIIKLRDLLYEDATYYFKRKFEKFDNFRIVNKVQERGVQCPNCSSQNTTKDGIRPPSIRMNCKNCDKKFSIRIEN